MNIINIYFYEVNTIFPLLQSGITETSLGDTDSTSPRPSTSTLVAIPFQDASAAAQESSMLEPG